ncbi:hypothetical protein GTP91_19290, partial [Rugamonas sp. FT82W]
MHIPIFLLLLPLCLAGCASGLHRAPGLGEPDVIPITEQLLAVQAGHAAEQGDGAAADPLPAGP